MEGAVVQCFAHCTINLDRYVSFPAMANISGEWSLKSYWTPSHFTKPAPTNIMKQAKTSPMTDSGVIFTKQWIDKWLKNTSYSISTMLNGSHLQRSLSPCALIRQVWRHLPGLEHFLGKGLGDHAICEAHIPLGAVRWPGNGSTAGGSNPVLNVLS